MSLPISAFHRLLPGFVGLVCLGLFVGQASALSPARVQTKAQNHAVKVDELTALHQAKHLLVQANHDYKGHRAKAVHEITKAIHEIEHHHKGKGKTGTVAAHKSPATAGVKQGKVHEPQVTSDQQLQSAIALLQRAAGDLGNGKHPKALTHVNSAIQELQTALKII